jgi:hypothetical protein
VFGFLAQMPRHHEAVSAVVALSAKHADATGRLGALMRLLFQENFRDTFAGGLHQRQARYIKALRRKTVNLAHFRCVQCFHRSFQG